MERAGPTATRRRACGKRLLHAFDAANLGNELWSSGTNAAFDDLGILAKYNVPTIANGKVYMPSFSGQVHVYGLLLGNRTPLVRLTSPTARSILVGPADVTLTATAVNVRSPASSGEDGSELHAAPVPVASAVATSLPSGSGPS